MRIIKEFKEFVNRGNVMDLAVAVIIGSAIQNIVNSIVNDFSSESHMTDCLMNTSILKSIRKLIANILHFLIVAFVLFLVVKAMNRAKEIIVKEEEPAEKPKDS